MLNAIVCVRSVAMLVLPLLLANSPTGRNLLKNGDFEKFKGSEPEGWETTNIPKVLTVVSPSTRVHGGKTAVRCDVKDFFGSKMAGMVCQKEVDIAGQSLQMNGYYALHSVGKDAGFVAFEFQNADGNTVKLYEENLIEPTEEFKLFSLTVPVPPSAEHLCVRCTILPGTGGERLHEGSYIVFDDLQVTALQEGGGNIIP